MRDAVVRLRQAFEPRVPDIQVRGISKGSQPFVLWRNRQLAAQRMRYDRRSQRRRRARAGAVLCRVPRHVLRDRSRALLRPEERPVGAAAHGRLPPDAGLLPRRCAALRAGARRVGPPRARRALVRPRLRDRGPDAAVSRLHLLRTRRAAAVHAGGPVRLRPRRGQGLHVRGQDDAAARGLPGEGPQERGGCPRRGGDRDLFRDDVRADSPGREGPPGRGAAPPRGPREVRRAGLPPAALARRARRPARVLSRVARAGRAGPRGGDPRRGRQRAAISPHFCYRVDQAEVGRRRSSRSPTMPWRAG